MRTFAFDAGQGRHIDRFGSNFIMSRLAHPPGLHVGCMHLPPGGCVGAHPAVVPQLFIVVAGAGWVQDAWGARTPITSGEAAFWEQGEVHAAGTDGGMTAIVVEGEALGTDPTAIGPVA